MKLYAKSALLVKHTAFGYQTELCNGYQRGASEDEVRGAYFKYLREKNPGYEIKDIILMEIPIDLMKEVVEFDRFTKELFPKDKVRPNLPIFDCVECNELRCTCPGEPNSN